MEIPSQTVQGKSVKAHYLAVFDAEQKIIGDAIQIVPPATIEMQLVGDAAGFQLWMPRPIIVVLSSPAIVGIALLNEHKQFLVAFSIPGNPELRKKNEEFIVRSRYIVMKPKQQS